MNIPISKELVTKRGLLSVQIEETIGLDFDLSGEGEYVDMGQVEGRILIDFEVNRSALMNRLERAKSPSLTDKLNMHLEDWSLEGANTDEFYLDYGMLLFKGAEPTAVDPTMDLGTTFDEETLRSNSPEDLKRELRMEEFYEMTYEELAEDIGEYLEREGIVADPSFGAPVHIQARANPGQGGTDYTISVENNEPTSINAITVKVSMPPEIGREVELGHEQSEPDSWTSEPAVSGKYDPEEGAYNFDVYSLSPVGEDGASREIRFHVPARAAGSLEEIAGRARFTRDQPFSNLTPLAVFDSGGFRLDDADAEINRTGHVDATFQTPVSPITVGSQAEVHKRFNVEGVTPHRAFDKVEEIVRGRTIDNAEFEKPQKSRNIRDSKESTVYSGSITDGTVLVEDNRVALTIGIEGEVYSSNQETAREVDDNLPAERRTITKEYGRTGVKITGKGTDHAVVERYVSDLRDEIDMSLQALSEEM